MLNVLDLVRDKGISPKFKGSSTKRGAEWCSPCPGCGGHDRFLIWPEQNSGAGSFACRKCGAAGDGISFLMTFNGLGYQEACRELGQEPRHSTRTLPRTPRSSRPDADVFTPTTVEAPAGLWQEKAGTLVRHAHETLLGNREQMAWLERRGIPEGAVREYRLGWVKGENAKNCLIRMRSGWGLPDDARKDANGVETVKRTLWIPRGLIIPAFAEDGNVVRIRIRRPEADRKQFAEKTKYYVLPGSSMGAMLVGSMLPAFVVVESELDALMLGWHGRGIIGAVSVMTAQVKAMDARVHAALSGAQRILVALDTDSAGRSGWPRWQASFPQAVRWPVIAGKDPGEMFEAGEDVKLWMLAGLPPSLLPDAFTASEPDSAPEPSGQICADALTEPAAVPEEPAQVPGPAPERKPAPERPVVRAFNETPLPTDWVIRHRFWEFLSESTSPEHALGQLRHLGLRVRAVVSAGAVTDFTVHGHQRWPGEGWGALLRWLRRNSAFVLEALRAREGKA